MWTSPQPLPWTPTYNREIADGGNSVVQYTHANIGQICLAVNAYPRLLQALTLIESWVRVPAEERYGTETNVLDLIATATGRMASDALASQIESLDGPNGAVERAIAQALRVPEANYTGSMDAALSLIPQGWRYSIGSREMARVDGGGVAAGTAIVNLVEVTTPSGGMICGANPSLPIAISAAAVRARAVLDAT